MSRARTAPVTGGEHVVHSAAWGCVRLRWADCARSDGRATAPPPRRSLCTVGRAPLFAVHSWPFGGPLTDHRCTATVRVRPKVHSEGRGAEHRAAGEDSGAAHGARRTDTIGGAAGGGTGCGGGGGVLAARERAAGARGPRRRPRPLRRPPLRLRAAGRRGVRGRRLLPRTGVGPRHGRLADLSAGRRRTLPRRRAHQPDRTRAATRPRRRRRPRTRRTPSSRACTPRRRAPSARRRATPPRPAPW